MPQEDSNTLSSKGTRLSIGAFLINIACLVANVWFFVMVYDETHYAGERWGIVIFWLFCIIFFALLAAIPTPLCIYAVTKQKRMRYKIALIIPLALAFLFLAAASYYAFFPPTMEEIYGD